MSRPQSFCVVPYNHAPLLEFSLPALGTEQDSRRARGLKSACLTGAFSANQRKPENSEPPSQLNQPARRISLRSVSARLNSTASALRCVCSITRRTRLMRSQGCQRRAALTSYFSFSPPGSTVSIRSPTFNCIGNSPSSGIGAGNGICPSAPGLGFVSRLGA